MSDGKRDKRPRFRCSAITAAGTRCRKPAVEGSDRCAHHSFRVPGRPSKLTQDVANRIVEALLEGNYLETSAALAGVSKASVYRWLRRADELEAKALEQTAEDDVDLYDLVDPDEWLYLDFRHATKAAEAWAERELLGLVRRAARGWQAYATILERRHPARWGRRLDAHVDHSGEVARTVEVIAPTDDERAAVLSRLQQAGAFDVADTENTDQED
jgi:AcrR family transcriptional regulator